MNGDEWRQEVVWGGRTLPSGVLLDFVETLPATSLYFSFCHSAAVLFQKPPSGVNTVLLSEIVCHERYTILCIRFHAKRVTRIFVTLL